MALFGRNWNYDLCSVMIRTVQNNSGQKLDGVCSYRRNFPHWVRLFKITKAITSIKREVLPETYTMGLSNKCIRIMIGPLMIKAIF